MYVHGPPASLLSSVDHVPDFEFPYLRIEDFFTVGEKNSSQKRVLSTNTSRNTDSVLNVHLRSKAITKERKGNVSSELCKQILDVSCRQFSFGTLLFQVL